LKKLSREELPELAKEIRKTIVDVVSKNGGHLASSLGAVELTIALHYVFNMPKDKIIWDVGHQAYTHKLLTGRKNKFNTLRQHGGLSGFTKMSESPYDSFTVGHSSTSISAGLGMASAKSLKGENAKVISVIGDGSMTAGLAFEGLNQTGDTDMDHIVILNDNDMSISKNVGALSSFLSRKLSVKYLQDLRSQFGEFLKSLPGIGDDIYKFAKRSEESFKTFVTPGMLFEALNFDYFGPINGHKLDHLIDILENIKKINAPVLLHVFTTKGKGYSLAEKNPMYFHGVGSFEVKTGNSINKKNSTPSYTKVFGDTLIDFAKHNKKVIAVTAAMPEGTGLSEFAKKFPKRFFDVGIAEPHGVTFAAGLSVEGFKPFVAIYSTFLQRAYDQILHDVCIESIPVAFAIDRGGIVGEDGPTHHGLFDFSFLRSLPNMVVMAPKDENELRRMMKTALDYNGPIAFRYPRGQGVGVNIDTNLKPLSIGVAEIITKGDDALILAIGSTVYIALEAATNLKKAGINVTVVNARFVKPMDSKLIVPLAKKIQNIITIEEHIRQGGFGSAVLECLNDNDVQNFKLIRLGIKDKFIEHGNQELLKKKYGIDSLTIEKTVHDLLKL